MSGLTSLMVTLDLSALHGEPTRVWSERERCSHPDCDDRLEPCGLAMLTAAGLMHESCFEDLTHGSPSVAAHRRT